MLSLSPGNRYFLYGQSADMRKSFDGLSGIVRNVLQQNPLSGDIFVFFNQKHTQVKLLLWEGDGFSIYHKRLEKGTYEKPIKNSTSARIKSQELHLILEGIVLQSIRRRKRFKIPCNS
jgi:transposase